MDLLVHPAAEAEAREAWLRYRSIDVNVARRFIATLDRVMMEIAQGPERAAVHVHGTRRAIVPRFPFSVIYRVGSSGVLVVAVAHQRRRPDYWRPRTARP